MVHFKLIKVTINAPSLVEVIIDIIVRYHGLPDLIVTNRGSLFTSKFWLLLCYFLGIKQKLSTIFYPQTDSQIKKQNSIIKTYLQVFVNFEQNNWAWLLSMAKFAYNNAKNANISHSSFKFNCKYHLCVSYKEELNLCSKSKIVEKLSSKLQNLIAICQQNLYHAQELQKQAHNKGVKPQSYTLGDNIWLNSNHLRTKKNCKLKTKFLGQFQVLHLVNKQANKFELPKK